MKVYLFSFWHSVMSKTMLSCVDLRIVAWLIFGGECLNIAICLMVTKTAFFPN